MLRERDDITIERIELKHAGIALGPDTQVEPVVVNCPACTKQFGQVPPVHEHVMERAIAAHFGHLGERLFKNACERCFTQLASTAS